MNRRQFHQTATAAAMALGAGPAPAADAAPAHAVPSIPTLDPLPAGASVRLGCNRLWHQWPASNPGLNDLTFSPDGRFLATLGYQDDHVFIWSVPDGRPVADWEPQHVDRGGSLLWTGRGLYVASGGGLSLWEPLSAKLVHRFTDNAMNGLALSPDGRMIAATTYIAGAVEVWDAATHRPVATFFSEIDGERPSLMKWGDILLSAAFSRCGRWLAAGGYAGTGGIAGHVHVWDIAARRHLTRFAAGVGPVGRAVFTPTGRLLTTDWSGTVTLWEVPEGRIIRSWPRAAAGGIPRSIAANASGQIAIQRLDGVRLWHPDPDRETLLCPTTGHCHLAYSDDGRFIAAGDGGTGRVSLFDATTGADLSPADRHAGGVCRIEMTADGAVCLVLLGNRAAQGHEAVLRDTRTGERLPVTPPPGFAALALAPTGTRIAGLSDGRLAIWDWSTGGVEVRAEADPKAVAWTPDGRGLLAADAEGRVTFDGRPQPSCPVPVLGLAITAGGLAAALSSVGEIHVWRVDADASPHRIAVAIRTPRYDFLLPVWPLLLSPDGSCVAVTSDEGVVYAGPVTAAELAAVYTHPPGEEETEDGHTLVSRYTPDGRLLIAGNSTALRDNEWLYTHTVADGASGDIVWRSPPQILWSGARTLTHDGQRLLTGGEDGTLLVWPLT